MAYYVFDDAKNLFEGMTKEEIIAHYQKGRKNI